MAVGDDGTHTAQLGQRQCLAVVSLTSLGVKAVVMGRNVAEQVKGVDHHSWSPPTKFDRAVDQASRIIEPTENQAGASQVIVRPAQELCDLSLRQLTIEELIALL